MCANERGNFLDLLLTGEARGYRMKFKTGKQQFGGESIFHVQRNAINICFGICQMAVSCLTLGGAGELNNGNEVQVLAADGTTPLGSIIKSKQCSHCCSFARNRFNAKAKPAYDILDAQGEIRFSIVVPVFQDKFLHCITAYYELEHLAIVPGPLTEERNRGAEQEGVGWVLELRPKNEHLIDDCYAAAEKLFKVLAFLTLGLTLLLKQILKVIEAFLALLRTCPINDLTQVRRPVVACCRRIFATAQQNTGLSLIPPPRLCAPGATPWHRGPAHDNSVLARPHRTAHQVSRQLHRG